MIKKKVYTAVLFTVFFISMILLGNHIFSGFNTFAMKSDKKIVSLTGSYVKVSDVSLGNVEVHDFRRMGFNTGYMKFSPDNKYLAVGTENGAVMLYSVYGKKIWQQQTGLGKITALEWARDGQKVYVGETSQQGSLICFEAMTGKELWRYNSANELGVDIKQKTYPGIVCIQTDGQDSIYAVGQRYIRNADHSEYYGRVYKLDNTGQLAKLFPTDHNLDAWVSWISVDHAGDRLVFGTANWDLGKTSNYQDSVYCLGESLDRAEWSRLIPPVPPYQNTTMRKSPDISADGKYVAGIASDGRCFLYDAAGQQLWQRTISQPQKAAGVYINATGLFVKFAGDYIAFTTGNTYNRANWQLPTPVEHPSSNSLFVFDLAGKLVKKCKAGGMIEGIEANKDYIVIAVGRNIRTKDINVHGMNIFSLQEADFIEHIPTEGPCVATAVSQDGKYVAAMEAPLKLDNGQIIGSYTLHLWQANL